MDYIPLNWEIIKQPLNWLIVGLMVTIALMALNLIFPTAEKET